MSTNDTEPSPWTRPSFITAAIVVAIVVMLGAALAIRAVTSPDDTTAAPTPTPSASAEPSETSDAADEESVCGLAGYETGGTVTTAPESTWDLIGTTAAPSIAASGPGVIEDSGLRYCFSRTPEGAVLAAANLFAMSSDVALIGPMMDRSAVPGPGRDAALALTETPAAQPTVRLQIAGFNLLEYDGDTATVDVAFRVSNNTQGAIAYELAWVDGDWKLQLRDDGALPNQPTQLPDLAGYVLWAGA